MRPSGQKVAECGEAQKAGTTAPAGWASQPCPLAGVVLGKQRSSRLPLTAAVALQMQGKHGAWYGAVIND